jgi:VanZ family protein
MDLRLRRFWIVAGWVLVLVVIYLSVAPVPIDPGVDEGDKISHVLAYAALMGWFASLYDGPSPRGMYATGFVAMGIALEFVQGWTGARSFESADMAANAMGVVAGWTLAPPRLPNVLQKVERVFW